MPFSIFHSPSFPLTSGAFFPSSPLRTTLQIPIYPVADLSMVKHHCSTTHHCARLRQNPIHLPPISLNIKPQSAWSPGQLAGCPQTSAQRASCFYDTELGSHDVLGPEELIGMEWGVVPVCESFSGLENDPVSGLIRQPVNQLASSVKEEF